MVEPVLSTDLTVSRWTREAFGGSAELSPASYAAAWDVRATLRLEALPVDLLNRLADPNQRWRVTLTPIEPKP